MFLIDLIQELMLELIRSLLVEGLAEHVRKHAARREAATAAFEAVKSDPTHPANAGTRAAFDAMRGTTPDYTEARAELDRTVRAADEALNETMARLRGELAAA